MGDVDKTKEQLLSELAELREHAAEFEASAAALNRAQEALQESEAQLRAVFEAARDAIFAKDRDGHYARVNTACSSIFGLTPNQMIGKTDFDLFPLEVAQHIKDEIDRRVLQRGEVVCAEETRPTVSVLRTFDVVKVPLRDTKGVIVGLCGVARDITERKQAEAEIKTALTEKEFLLKEIQHRVKNNLQLVCSFLDMSSLRIHDEKAIGLLTDARARIHSMSLVHSQLYGSEGFDQIEMGSHLRELVSYLSKVYAQTKAISPVVEVSSLYLSITQAIPCTLALNELISNAFKHAFKEGAKGTIEVSMQRSDDGTILIGVKDDGIGIGQEVDIHKTDSMGLKLVRNLVEKQLSGKIELQCNKGTEFIIEFKIPEKEVVKHV